MTLFEPFFSMMLLNFVGVLLLGASSSLHAARGVDPESKHINRFKGASTNSLEEHSTGFEFCHSFDKI
jgi:hypothetical protein